MVNLQFPSNAEVFAWRNVTSLPYGRSLNYVFKTVMWIITKTGNYGFELNSISFH